MKQEVNFDKRAIPGIAVFILLITIGFYMFFHWRAERGIGEPEEKVTIAATIFPIYDIVSNVIGNNEYIEVIQVIPSGTNPASYELSEENKEQLLNSDAVFKIGVDFDDWMSDISSNGELRIIDLSQAVELMEKEQLEVDDTKTGIDYKLICEENSGDWLNEYYECGGISQDVCEENGGEYDACASACRHSSDSVMCIQMCVEVCRFEQGKILNVDVDEEAEEQYDPYYWLSIENAKTISEVVYLELSILKPEYKEVLYQNYSSYIQSLDEAKSYMEDQVADLENTDIVTLSEAFNYLADEYGLEIAAAYNEQEFSNEYLPEIESVFNEYGIQEIYKEPQMSDDIINSISWDRVIELRVLDPYGGSEQTESYIDLMRFNIDSICGEAED